MKALFLIDSPNKISFKEVEKPSPGQGQVLVKLKAAALNRRDQWMRVGKYPNIQFDTILGSDGTGIVEAVGKNTHENLIGKEVVINPNINWGDNPLVQSKTYSILGMPVHGTFAEYIVVGADKIYPKPKHLNWKGAAALPLAGLTAFRALFTQGQVKKNKTVLISGVGGGVAQFAFLFAVAAKAKVYVSSGNQEKINTCLQRGAVEGFNYKQENWQKLALQSSGGFDVIIDSAGGDQVNDLIKIVKPGGRIVFYGATNGMPKSLDMFRMFWNQIALQGSTMGNDQEFEDMVSFVTEHKIYPIIDSIVSFDNIFEAFDKMENGKTFGKLVVSME